MRISKSFSIDAAHILALPYKSKCNHIHGHTYTIDVVLDGPLNPEGMVLDYNEIPSDIINEADHKLIIPARYTRRIQTGRWLVDMKNANGIIQIEVPETFLYVIQQPQSTSEYLAEHFFNKLIAGGLPVYSVMVSETPKTKAVYYGKEVT